MQFSGKLINQTWENDNKLNLEPNLFYLAQIWGTKFSYVSFTFISS